MQHTKRGLRILRLDKAQSDVFAGAGCAGVTSVDIHIHGRRHVARHQRSLVEMNVIHRIHDTGNVIKVSQRRFSILARFTVHHVHGRAASTEVGIRTT